VRDGKVGWERLRSTVYGAVRFLDDVISVNRFPLPEIREATLTARKIGLGVMGFADLLFLLGVRYGSPEAESVAHSVMEAVAFWSKEASHELALHRGSFPAFRGSVYEQGELPIPANDWPRHDGAPHFDWDDLRRRVARKGIRNATTTTIAPTGSISFVAGCSSGIEPAFALAFTRTVLDGTKFTEVNPAFEAVARERGVYSPDLIDRVAASGSLDGLEVDEDLRDVFVTAHDISPEWHVRIQAAFQRFTDNAVSKTINFANEATVDDVATAYGLAYNLGCKGITVYRDGSRQQQVLTRGTQAKPEQAAIAESPIGAPAPRPRADVTRGSTERIVLGCGRKLYITVNEDEVGLCEVFVQGGRSGGCTASQSEAVARLISLAFRSGIDAGPVINELRGIRCPSPAWSNGTVILSCADAIARAIERYVGRNGHEVAQAGQGPMDLSPECPECGALVQFREGCIVCPGCGYSQCS
jgi:ribonucleoside-diphosphate reductase alpha chain